MPSYQQARDSMYLSIENVVTQFEYAPYIQYPMMVNSSKVDASKIWLRVNAQIATEEQSALSACVQYEGGRLFTTYGILIIEMYIPRTEPNGEKALTWATLLRDNFRNHSSKDSVIYRNARIDNGILPEDNYFRLNILVDFEYDEVK